MASSGVAAADVAGAGAASDASEPNSGTGVPFTSFDSAGFGSKGLDVSGGADVVWSADTDDEDGLGTTAAMVTGDAGAGATGISLASIFGSGMFRVLSDRKSTRLNSSHLGISYAVFC